MARLIALFLPLGVSFFLVACPSLPGSKASGSAEGLGIPEGYDSGRAAVPELVSSLSGVFGGGDLKRQIRLSQEKNPDLAEAAANLEEAGFNTRIARAGLFPSVAANGNSSRSQANSAGSGNNFGSVITQRLSASLDAQWEVDVWGRIRAGVDASKASFIAADADYAAASQSIAAQTAQAYFNLVAAEQLQALAQERLDSFQSTFDLVNRRFELGTGDLER